MAFNLHKLFLSPYLILISFNAAFAISEYLQVYILASIPLIIFFLLNILSNELPKNFFQVIDIPIIFFSINNIFLLIIYPSLGALNYFFVYLYTFVLIYFSIKYYLLKIGWKSFIQIANIGLYFVIFFVIFNFIVFKITGTNLQVFIPRIGPSADSVTFQGFLMRAYGFSNEPTNLSSYFLSFGILAIFFNSKYNKNFVFPLIGILLFAALLSYSSGFFISICIAFFVVLIYLLIDTFLFFKIKKKNVLYAFLLTAVIAQIFIFIPEIFRKILVFEQFMFSRGNLWVNIWSSIVDNNFSPNGLSSAPPVVNWYLMLLYENGLISLLLIFTFILILINKVRKSNLSKNDKLFFYFGIVAIFFQINSFSNFYYPFYLIYSLVISNIVDFYNKVKLKPIKFEE